MEKGCSGRRYEPCHVEKGVDYQKSVPLTRYVIRSARCHDHDDCSKKPRGPYSIPSDSRADHRAVRLTHSQTQQRDSPRRLRIKFASRYDVAPSIRRNLKPDRSDRLVSVRKELSLSTRHPSPAIAPPLRRCDMRGARFGTAKGPNSASKIFPHRLAAAVTCDRDVHRR